MYVQQHRGLDFVQQARSRLTPEDVEIADSLTYVKGDTSFLGKRS